MPEPIHGVVKNGLIVPDEPLPEGSHVQITLPGADLSPELEEELAAWQRANANALDLVERLAAQDLADETR